MGGQLDCPPTCVAFSPLAPEARFGGEREGCRFTLSEADAKPKSQAGVTVCERALLLEKLSNIADGVTPRNRSRHIRRSLVNRAPSEVEAGASLLR
jgi:hypothetical protein